MISNCAQYMDASGRFRPDLTCEPINLIFTRQPSPAKADLTGIGHLTQGRYPMTSDDRLKVVAYIFEHPGCKAIEIKQGASIEGDVNEILYDLVRRQKVLIRSGTKKPYVYHIAKPEEVAK